MTSMQFVLQPLPGTDEQFIERIREVSEKVNKYGFGTHRIFEQLKIPVKEVVIGPNHIGVLLEDGKAFRVAFSINSERLDLSKADPSKSTQNSSGPTNAPKNSAPASSRPMPRSRARLMRTTGRSGASGQGSGSRSTGVIIGGSSSSRPLVTVPATYVPEELISQAEVVLQGKSRNLIIRELQRTNLDVNLAVNNLLSRDDEEAEDTEEGGDNYVPEDLISLLDNGFHGDNNSVIIDPSDGLFSEEIFSNYSSIRNLLFDRIRSERNQANANSSDANQSGRVPSSAPSVLSSSGNLSAQISSVTADREAFSRWRDRQYYGPRRWINKEEYTWEKDSDSKKKEPSTMSSPVWISEELQPWPDKNSSIRFKKIAALYSEFIALSENGELHQWRWADNEPYKCEVENIYHPKTLSLNIVDKVENISANFIRCSVVTEGGNRVATWMDEQLGPLGTKLEHIVMGFSEFVMDPIKSIHVCSLYTAVRTENGNVYWWGVLPFDQRRCLWDKFRTKTKKPFKVTTPDISVGAQVVMKKCPIYQMGSVGFTCTSGVPKVGQLLNSVWNFSDICRFKILNMGNTTTVEKSQAGGSGSSNSTHSAEKDAKTVVAQTSGSSKPSTPNSTSKESTDRIDMPPPPSPASSTCSDTGSVTSHKRTKRVTMKDDNNSSAETAKKDEELWQLKDVVFVDDKIGPIGKVLKVDGDFVAVRFPTTSSTALNKEAESSKEEDWQQCRLLRREDVQIYKTAMTSRGPDWLQRVPKKININHGVSDSSNFQLLTMSVDTRGIHVIKKLNSKLHYSLYNLYNSKQEQNCQFPTDCASFMGASLSAIAMNCNNDCNGNSSTIVLRDGNSALYPLAKDCISSIKDPQWFDLPPVKSVTMTTISLPSSCVNLKSKVCMTALVFETQKLMPHILRCDVKNSIAVLSHLEKDERNDVAQIVEERCDGSRNIFHACVVMCGPTSNKDNNDNPTTTTNTTNDKKSFVSNLTLPRSGSVYGAFSGSSGGGSGGAGVGGAGGSNSSGSDNSTFAVSSGSISRENRISLRDMMHRLISNDQNEQANQSPSAAAAGNNASDDHAYIPVHWSIETANNSNAAAAAAPSNLPDGGAPEDDISKIISASASGSPSGGKTSANYDPSQRREHATIILRQMCGSNALRPYLHQLLSAKDAQGQTPFMLAVYSRAYEAGITILNTILTLCEQDPSIKDSMIFPAGSPADQSPLHVICYNDTCSFTWTGADHINQNIFECKTCGLTGSLCCCTECARVCHKGHDCKLKRTSPTAYCDCWEKCKCKALIAGNLTKRYALLCKLASCTDLVTKFNSKGESILLFLIQTVGRQTVEQRQYRFSVRVRNVGTSSGSNSNNASVVTNRKSASADVESDMPEHDLEPPRFARKALERLLIDWPAVRSMILTGAEKSENYPMQFPNSVESMDAESYNIYLQSQHGSTLLDKFTHNLFVKCSSDHLDTLLVTLVREMQNTSVPGRSKEAEDVARRFVRSVARVFVIFNMEKQPNPERRKSQLSSNKHVQSCIKVFTTLHKLSIEELCEVSEALIAPVRLGVVRPTGPFAMSSSNLDNSDDLFSVDPLAPTSAVDPIIEPQASPDVAHDQGVGFNIQQGYGIENVDQIRDSSEIDESVARESNAHAHEDDIIENARNEEGMQDDESDNDFTFNDAETESDSDDNQSNQDAQRSVQTGATVGSETDIGVLFLDDESGDSSQQDEDGSDDAETDDHSDEFNFNDQQLERRSTNTNTRNDLTPQSMQWAIRTRDTARATARPAGNNLVFIDPMALRRSTVPASTAVAAPPPEQHTMATTASNLARAFGIIIRQISELLSNLTYNIINDIESPLKINSEDAIAVQNFVEKRLKATWDWMFTVMDGTEAQLKFGAYLANFTDPTHPLHPLNLSAQSNPTNQPQNNPSSSNASSVGMNGNGSTTRRDFFTYCLSLMRAHTSEHRDALPVLDITALRHVAYVLDAFIYYMRNDTHFYEKIDASLNTTMIASGAGAGSSVENEDTDEELMPSETIAEDTASVMGSPTSTGSKKQSFFARSDSTLSLGCLAPEGFEMPLDVAMPLADKPHLLQPNSKRQDLFANLPLLGSDSEFESPNNKKITHSEIDTPPLKLGFSTCMKASADSGSEIEADDQEGMVLDTNSNPNASIFDDFVEQPTTSAAASNNNSTDSRRKFSRMLDKSDSSDSNVYVQLKKKQCLDVSHHGLQSDKPEPMETDDDNRASDDESRKTSTPDNQLLTRPEVIITPNKTQLHQRSPEAASEIVVQSPSNTTVRSVIVRAGTSTSDLMDQNDSTSAAELKDGFLLSSSAGGICDNEKLGEDNSHKTNTSYGFPMRGLQFYKCYLSELPSWNFLLSRWKLALDLFGRVFMDDVGMESGSILPELRGFPVKEMRFRRHMEKLRNGQQRDLILCKLERNRESLIIQTFKELNSQFGNSNRRAQPPLTFNRVKVTFKDEPGEGSGVARSFYTSISEALLATAKMPNLDSVQVGAPSSKYGVPFSSILRNRGASGSGRDPPNLQRRGTGSKILWRTSRERKALNYDARPYTPVSGSTDNSGSETANDHLSVHLQQLGERLYPKIYSINPANAPKITGMLLEIATPQLLAVLSSDDTLRQKINEALEIITIKQKSEAASVSSQTKKNSPVVIEPIEDDNEPLFYSPGKRGFYTPRQGFASFERINAFRNIGRLIGLCLLQNELLPLFLQRHVLKHILGRKIKFHDLAFFDPALYESFRQMIQNLSTEEGEENINRMELTFVIDLVKEEGGGNRDLIPGGRDIPVTSSNLYEYIRRYTEYRLIKSQEKALEAIKDGVFDVLPDNCMNSLTSEDLRLLLNGVGDINVSTLISYTTFNDESSEGSDKLLKFKRWFWSIVEKMNTLERQDLVYFWTGSPALPASEEGFQPLPSVTIRPADDSHLPTANTCISRLYIPLYSSKSILRSKMLLAIKSKNFGFV